MDCHYQISAIENRQVAVSYVRLHLVVPDEYVTHNRRQEATKQPVVEIVDSMILAAYHDAEEPKGVADKVQEVTCVVSSDAGTTGIYEQHQE